MAAFSLETSGVFDEFDGQWSTFNLEVGTGKSGGQSFRAVVSTSSFSALLPGLQSCNFSTNIQFPTNCLFTRGVGQYQSRQNTGYDGSLIGSLLGGGVQGIEDVSFGTDLNATFIFGPNYTVPATVWEDYISLSNSGSFESKQNPVRIFCCNITKLLARYHRRRIWFQATDIVIFDKPDVVNEFDIEEYGISRANPKFVMGLHSRCILW